MIDLDRWRDQQIYAFSALDRPRETILEQEKVMLDFVTRFPAVRWRWAGHNNSFKNICSRYISIVDHDFDGMILFDKSLTNLTSSQLVSKVSAEIKNVDYVYLAIDRYNVIKHDLDFDLPDDIETSLDLIVQRCDPRFRRLHNFPHVDGNHMVAAHPMDCYGLCKS